MTRVDSLMQELSERHRNRDPRFLEAVRPMVARILEPGLSETARLGLMEMLAETFERDVQVREDLAVTRANLEAFFENIIRLLRGE